MSRRDAAQLVRRHGATVVEKPDALVHLAVIGENELAVPEAEGPQQWFDEPTLDAVERGTLQVLSETQLWQRLGLVDEFQRLYTPAMLAELLDVPVTVIRRWHRRGLIVPVREVRRLPYFDFPQVANARRLAELLAAGVSPKQIEQKLAALARYLPDVSRPLAQLSVIIEGKQILLRQGDGLVEPGGQLRFDFDAGEAGRSAEAAPTEGSAADTASAQTATDGIAPKEVSRDETTSEEIIVTLPQRDARPDPTSPTDLCRYAAELEETGNLPGAVDTYRAALAAGGPQAEICFQLAELLYRQGELGASRERYFMAIELDEDYVEARANLGCVLAEMGQLELAVAAFEGALQHHADYADVHYHLARTLDELDHRDPAEHHWRAFLALAPDSPWAEEAHDRLGDEASELSADEL